MLQNLGFKSKSLSLRRVLPWGAHVGGGPPPRRGTPTEGPGYRLTPLCHRQGTTLARPMVSPQSEKGLLLGRGPQIAAISGPSPLSYHPEYTITVNSTQWVFCSLPHPPPPTPPPPPPTPTPQPGYRLTPLCHLQGTTLARPMVSPRSEKGLLLGRGPQRAAISGPSPLSYHPEYTITVNSTQWVFCSLPTPPPPTPTPTPPPPPHPHPTPPPPPPPPTKNRGTKYAK